MIMYLLDKQQNIIKAISDGIIEAKMTEEINAADKLSFSLVQDKRLANSIYFVCIPATRGDAFLIFKIISESVKDDRIEYTCIESAYDELKSYAYIKDVRPQDKTASEMLRIALDGTRWEVGYSEETTRKRTNFYYISTLEAIQKVVELFKIELTFTVIIDPITNKIARRQVNLYSQQGERTGKRFEYGSNLLSVTREESSEDLVTALVGRGKGEQLDDGNDDTVDGYGRRIMFTDVIWSKANGHPTDKPAGQDYVEDKEATKLYGFDDGKPRIGIAVFEDIEDVNQLINATWAALQVAKRPKVSFKASALDIGDLGLGDTVAIIRHELNIEYFTRVYKVEHDLLDKNNNVIELGDDFSEKSLTNYVASVKEAQEETSRVANIALTSANGKNKNFYSNVKPTIASEGDNLFLDLGNGETEYYVWKNGNWELILSTAELNTTKKEVDKALSDIEDVRSQADQAFKELADSISAKYNQVHNEMQSSFDGLMPVINAAINHATDAKKQLNNALSEVGRIDYSMKALQSSYANLNGEISQTKQTANQISTKLANTQGDITKLVSKAGKLEQQLLSKVDTTLFENFREATSRELKQRLTATDLNGYVKSTELVQTANGIRASVSAVDGKLNDLKIGGANLIPNSNASETEAVAWTGTRLVTHPFYYNSTKNMFNVDNSTNLITAAVSQRFAIKPNTQYTLSYVGFMSVNSGGYNIFLRGRKGNVDKESQFIQGGRLSVSSAEYKHVTFTTGDIDNAELTFNVDGSTNGNVSNFFFNEVMLVEGNKDLRWGPAPKDVENRYASLNVEVDKLNAVTNELNAAIDLRVQKNELLSQINLQAGHTLIQSKKIYLDAETVAFSGKAFIPNAAIVDLRADKITAGTLNASKVSIINLDVNRLTGNKTEFVKSSWRSAYGNYVNIDYSGMRVTYGNTTTEFNSYGMEITAVGESIGGIGWQGMKNMPPYYQGLLFWLDGGGDYMAWAARNNGNYDMNPLIKLSWYRKEWTPPNSNAGFNFYDNVTFNDIVYPSGNPSDGMALRFFTTNYNGHSYPTIGSASMKSGIMFGDWDLFLIFNNRVIPLQGWKIPVSFDQGRVSYYKEI